MTSHSHPPRILLIEEDADTREIVSQLLEDEKFQVLPVTDFEEGMGVLRSQAVSLVLSDFLITPTRREETWNELDQLRRAAHPAKMALISTVGVEDAEVLARGFAFALKKPFGIETLLLNVGAHARHASPDPAQANTVAHYFRALTQKNWGALAALCTEDVQYHLPGDNPQFCTTIRGRQAFREFAAKTFGAFPDAEFALDEVVALPRAVIGRYRGAWSQSGAGRQEMSGAVLFHFEGEQIRELGIRLEVAALLAKIQPAAQ